MYVKSLLEQDAVLSDITIKGEISNYTKHYKTGHLYFSLKDEKAQVKAVMFRANAQGLAFEPENGMSVVVSCRVSLYERDGTFQLYVDAIFPDGAGAARLAYEQLKLKLASEGFFDIARKRPLAPRPKKVGLITSKTGAAIHDILSQTQRRYPFVEYVLYPASVQGAKAEKEVVSGLVALNKVADIDFIIVARGGGSSDDLYVFNSEKIARAVFASSVPVVSAIGHEVDYTILDYVADVRVATPTAAVEVCMPDASVYKGNVINVSNKLHTFLSNKLYTNLAALRAAAPKIKQLTAANFAQKYANLQALAQSSHGAMQLVFLKFDADIELHEKLLNELNPEKIYRRGFASVMKQNKTITAVATLKIGDEVDVKLKDGSFAATVNAINKSGD